MTNEDTFADMLRPIDSYAPCVQLYYKSIREAVDLNDHLASLLMVETACIGALGV